MVRPNIQLPNLITLEDFHFVYRPNFEGRAEQYNNAGNRYFNAGIPDELGPLLLRDGWNIKQTKPGRNHPNPEEHVPEFYLEVKVSYKVRPPKIIFIRDGRHTPIGEDTVALVDTTEFETMDTVIRPVAYEKPEGGFGITAYLKSFYGTVEMDDLDRKYASTQVHTSGLTEEDDL